MGLLWRLTKAAGKYGALYAVAIVSTLALALLNLAGAKVLSEITGYPQYRMLTGYSYWKRVVSCSTVRTRNCLGRTDYTCG